MHQHSQDPRFKVTCQIDAEGIKPETFVFEGETPREIMDQFKQLIGDANASVSVSTDMGVKKYGSGASAMVTVSLTCGQDQASINAAMELASQCGRYYAKLYSQQAEAELRNLLQSQGRAVEF